MSKNYDRWKRPLRILSAALIVSLSVNIILLGYLVYLKLDYAILPISRADYEGNQEHLAIFLSNLEIYNELRQLRTETLAKHLQDSRWADDGLKVRDIALGILVRERFFDIERALGSLPSSRDIVIGNARIPIFNGITGTQFTSLATFGTGEKWPMTPQGMFIVLKTVQEPNPSLEEAFMMTPVFQKLSRLFSKADKQQTLKLALEGDWNLLNNLPQSPPFALLEFIDRGSSTAASLLLALEPQFAFKKLDDEHTLKVLHLLTERTPTTAKFALSVLASQRGEEVKAAAMQKLSSFSDKTAFLASLQPVKETKPVVPPFAQARYHTIQPGDNLWKIAKKWNVSLEELKKKNRLENNAILQPGAVLVIP